MSDYSISTIDTSENVPTLAVLVFCINRSRKDIELILSSTFSKVLNHMPIRVGR